VIGFFGSLDDLLQFVEHVTVQVSEQHAVDVEGIVAGEPRRGEQAVSTNLAAHALAGGYASLLGPSDHDQIARAYESADRPKMEGDMGQL
jgi:hypothetical protein